MTSGKIANCTGCKYKESIIHFTEDVYRPYCGKCSKFFADMQDDQCPGKEIFSKRNRKRKAKRMSNK